MRSEVLVRLKKLDRQVGLILSQIRKRSLTKSFGNGSAVELLRALKQMFRYIGRLHAIRIVPLIKQAISVLRTSSSTLALSHLSHSFTSSISRD
jgi:hypothetical protein